MAKSLANVKAKEEAERATKNALVDRYQTLLDTERAYFKLAKRFQDACQQSANLEEQLEAAQASRNT